METVRENRASFRFEHSHVAWSFTQDLGSDIYIGNYTTIGQVDNPVSRGQSPTSPVKFGNNVSIGNCCSISEGVALGDNVKIGNNVVIRSGVTISKGCVIGHGTVFEGDAFVGEQTLIHAQCHITKGVKIGKRVFIAPYFVGANDPRCLRRELYANNPCFEPEPYIIEDGARIGIGVILLPNVVIGKNAQVGAGSIVTHNVEPATLVMGTPARVYRQIPEKEWAVK